MSDEPIAYEKWILRGWSGLTGLAFLGGFAYPLWLKLDGRERFQVALCGIAGSLVLAFFVRHNILHWKKLKRQADEHGALTKKSYWVPSKACTLRLKYDRRPAVVYGAGPTRLYFNLFIQNTSPVSLSLARLELAEWAVETADGNRVLIKGLDHVHSEPLHTLPPGAGTEMRIKVTSDQVFDLRHAPIVRLRVTAKLALATEHWGDFTVRDGSLALASAEEAQR